MCLYTYIYTDIPYLTQFITAIDRTPLGGGAGGGGGEEGLGAGGGEGAEGYIRPNQIYFTPPKKSLFSHDIWPTWGGRKAE